MNNDDKLRRVKHLMYKHPSSHISRMTKQYLDELYEKHKDDRHKISNKWWSRILEMKEIYKLTEELGMSEKLANEMWLDLSIKRTKNSDEYNKRPPKEGRDNKNVHAFGSGVNSNRNKIRYPSKKRSIRTWKKFYKLFPHQAIIDGWDGKTSKKMK